MRAVVENAGHNVICGPLCITLQPSLALSPSQLGGGLLWALELSLLSSLGPGPHVHKITNAPVFFMELDVMDFWRKISITRASYRGGP